MPQERNLDAPEVHTPVEHTPERHEPERFAPETFVPRETPATAAEIIPWKLKAPYEPGVNPALPDSWTSNERDSSVTREPLEPYEAAFREVILVEGGYADHPDDRGGRTMFGLASKYHPELFEGGALPTIGDAHRVYREGYWDRVAGDMLAAIDPGLAHVVFDAAVNHGSDRATRQLQRAVGTAADGVLGPQTLAAIGATGSRKAMEGLIAQRRELYENLVAQDASQGSFAKGWEARLVRLEELYLGEDDA